MYKTELIRRVARETGLSQRVVGQVLTSSLRGVQRALVAGERVTIPGFGTFYTSHRRSSRVRSVRTGHQVEVPARRVAAFRGGKVLKRAVGGKRGRRWGVLGRKCATVGRHTVQGRDGESCPVVKRTSAAGITS